MFSYLSLLAHLWCFGIAVLLLKFTNVCKMVMCEAKMDELSRNLKIKKEI